MNENKILIWKTKMVVEKRTQIELYEKWYNSETPSISVTSSNGYGHYYINFKKIVTMI